MTIQDDNNNTNRTALFQDASFLPARPDYMVRTWPVFLRQPPRHAQLQYNVTREASIEPLLQSRWRPDLELKKAIPELSQALCIQGANGLGKIPAHRKAELGCPSPHMYLQMTNKYAIPGQNNAAAARLMGVSQVDHPGTSVFRTGAVSRLTQMLIMVSSKVQRPETIGSAMI